LRAAASDAASLLLEDVLAEVSAVGADVDVAGAFNHWPNFATGLAAEAAGSHLATAEATVAATSTTTGCTTAAWSTGAAAGSAAETIAKLTTTTALGITRVAIGTLRNGGVWFTARHGLHLSVAP
jgi:hypothetical protein